MRTKTYQGRLNELREQQMVICSGDYGTDSEGCSVREYLHKDGSVKQFPVGYCKWSTKKQREYFESNAKVFNTSRRAWKGQEDVENKKHLYPRCNVWGLSQFYSYEDYQAEKRKQ